MSSYAMKFIIALLIGFLVMSTAALIASLAAAAVLTSRAEAQTFRDASGRLTGTASRDANGTITYRDGSGRMTGTATHDRNGTTTFRDASGRMLGTSQFDGPGRRR